MPDVKKSGTTWIELLVNVDLQGSRSAKSFQKKDNQAHQRFLERNKNVEEGLGSDAQTPLSHEAGSKPSLALELATFKTAFRKVVREYVPTHL